MSATTFADTSHKGAAESQWAVETHGLTKRFGDNVAVAIVDRGKVIRQGSISELLAGASLMLQVECSEPDRARALIEGANIAAHIEVGPLGLGVTMPGGTPRDAVAEINRILVEGRISVYRLQEVQASLETWFLQVTSRLGAP